MHDEFHAKSQKNSYPALHLVTRLIKLALLRIFWAAHKKFLSRLRVFLFHHLHCKCCTKKTLLLALWDQKPN
ncbi:hypothetical protein C3420_07665 [Acinetobacter sp. ACNIH3]|nr:hypothetical protein [Acinetobacter sp. GFQ9D191M]NHC01474.1 hypothetical protein [Acinetobacter sp. GFQ9D192M]POU24739.1 hypothetical protein C3420_07665 [Acinetobacter sp. ACNIH3]POV70264.1 hypothetical protein C3421_17040 [Acinetobacter sp. ACNIH4]